MEMMNVGSGEKKCEKWVGEKGPNVQPFPE